MAIFSPSIHDLRDLHRLESTCFEYDQISVRQFRYLLTKACSIFLVDREGSDIRGYILGLYRRGSLGVYLYSLAVDPRYRGRGIGSQLLTAFETEVRTRDYAQMKAHTKQSNTKMRGVFMRAGWTETKVVSHFYEDGEDAVELLKRIVS